MTYRSIAAERAAAIQDEVDDLIECLRRLDYTDDLIVQALEGGIARILADRQRETIQRRLDEQDKAKRAT